MSLPDPFAHASLAGKTAVITGAGRGIGHASAQALAAAGAAVVVADCDRVAADAVCKEILASGGQATAVCGDVASEDDVRALMAQSIARYGGIDVLVNNAGIFPRSPVATMDAADFDRVLAVNLRGVFLCTREACVAMIDQGRGGAIVNITSIDALHPSMVGLGHYDASKHGVWGLTQSVALEMAPHGIRVNALAPGGVLTEGVRAMGASTTDAVEVFAARIPLGRMAYPEEIARMVLVLASDYSSYMTGSHVVVDGGALLS